MDAVKLVREWLQMVSVRDVVQVSWVMSQEAASTPQPPPQKKKPLGSQNSPGGRNI